MATISDWYRLWRAKTSTHWTGFVDKTLFPPTCILCGDQGHRLDLCAGCRADLPWINVACLNCGLPLPDPQLISNRCGRCQQQPPSYDRLFAAFIYEPPIDNLIISLKFHARLAHARLLGELLADYLVARVHPLPDLILPVPLHPTCLRTRGYNQALELARPIARRLGLPVDVTRCQRILATNAQSSTVNVETRRRNVHGAFAITSGQEMVGCRVAILDDVVTTGYTVEEIAYVLRQTGVKEIEVWAIARTILL